MGSQYKGNEKEVLALSTWIKLARANNSVFNKIKPSMTKNGLSTSQFAVLETLYHLGSMSQKSIGNKLLRTSGNIVKVLDNLERDGLVSRAKNIADRRAYNILLTDNGQEMIKSIFNNHVKCIVESFSSLTETEQIELSRLCKKLGLGQAL